jgi:hypothetical protein
MYSCAAPRRGGISSSPVTPGSVTPAGFRHPGLRLKGPFGALEFGEVYNHEILTGGPEGEKPATFGSGREAPKGPLSRSPG